MPSRLKSDGAKIRALRVQRGWTQEQLAEISGVSSRTIQRAETAGSAAFDTLRAVAGAFETDFNQLLRTEPCQMPEPAPQVLPQLEQVAGSASESREMTYLSQLAQPFPRGWTMFPIAAAALAAGLLAGGILVYLFYPSVELNFSTPLTSPPVAERVGAGEESSVPPIVSSAIDVATIPGRKPRHLVEKPENQHPPAAVEVIQFTDPGPQATIPEPVQSASLELPLPRNLPPILAASEMPGVWTAGLAHPGDLAQTDPAVGAVRQNIGLAAKKTSDALAKVSASIRRVF